jgi:Ca2+-binding EF-hand superfamily protein
VRIRFIIVVTIVLLAPGLAYSQEQGAGQRGGSLEVRFKQLDRNGDGKVTADEFPRAETFKQMDKNGHGVVALDEAKEFWTGRPRRQSGRPGKER